MLETVFGLLHNATTLLFGVYISAAFLGIKMSKKNILNLLMFSFTVGLVYISSYLLFGTEGTEKIYPFIIHLPLTLYLTFKFKYKFPVSLLSVLTAYLCCQISNWVGIVALNITSKLWVYYCVRTVITVAVFILLIQYVSDATAQLISKPAKSILIFGILPLVYYLFDYIAGVYTSLLYSGREIIVEFLGFMLCISYIIFIFLYFKQYEEKREAEQLNTLIEMKRKQSEKDIEIIRRSENTIRILRHDMRHFLMNISSLIENGENDKAIKYIGEVVSYADKTAVKKYCSNELVNMIISSFEEEIKNNGIELKYRFEIPEQLSISEIDLSSLLSNAIENAINAAKNADEKLIDIFMSKTSEKLLISVKNTFKEMPEMVNGIPTTSKEGHGYGTQSIRYTTEKLNGNCHFTVSGNLFVLQVII